MTIENYQNQLINNRLMRNDIEIDFFEEAVERVFDEKNIDTLKILMEGFDDKTNQEEVMFSLIHRMEHFVSQNGINEYLRIVFENIQRLFPHAKRWAEIIILRLMNDGDTFLLLVSKIQNLTYKTKEDVKEIIQNLTIRNPNKFKEKGEKLLCQI